MKNYAWGKSGKNSKYIQDLFNEVYPIVSSV